MKHEEIFIALLILIAFVLILNTLLLGHFIDIVKNKSYNE